MVISAISGSLSFDFFCMNFQISRALLLFCSLSSGACGVAGFESFRGLPALFAVGWAATALAGGGSVERVTFFGRESVDCALDSASRAEDRVAVLRDGSTTVFGASLDSLTGLAGALFVCGSEGLDCVAAALGDGDTTGALTPNASGLIFRRC